MSESVSELRSSVQEMLAHLKNKLRSQVNPKGKPECQLNHNLINKKVDMEINDKYRSNMNQEILIQIIMTWG